jgi:hypothetical protein
MASPELANSYLEINPLAEEASRDKPSGLVRLDVRHLVVDAGRRVGAKHAGRGVGANLYGRWS